MALSVSAHLTSCYVCLFMWDSRLCPRHDCKQQEHDCKRCKATSEFPSCHAVTHELPSQVRNYSSIHSSPIAFLAWLGARAPCPVLYVDTRVVTLARCYRDDTRTQHSTQSHRKARHFDVCGCLYALMCVRACDRLCIPFCFQKKHYVQNQPKDR